MDQALVSDITEKEILEIKKEHITKPVKESIKERGEQPSLFKIILGKAILVLEKLIIKVKEATVKAAEIIKEAATKSEEIVESVITEVKAPKVADTTSEKVFVELIEEPEKPTAPILDYDINKLLAIYDILQDKNKEIYAAQKRKNDKMLELDDTSKFNFVKHSGLSVEIQNLERAIEEMQGELSETVQKYGFDTVQEFMNVLRTVKKVVTEYQSDMKSWKEMREIIKNTNAMILSGELTIDFAIELLEQRGYKVKIIKKDIQEIPKDSSLFAKLSRAKHRADERNERTSQKNGGKGPDSRRYQKHG